MTNILLLTACLATGQADDAIQDVLYLGAGKPAVVRLHVTSGGKPVQAKWDDFMAKLFAFLDANKSGGLDRVEATKAIHPDQMALMFQGQSLNQRMMRGAMSPTPAFAEMDANRDGKITLEEMKAYYIARSCGPLQVNAQPAGTGAAAAFDPSSDRLFQMLDADEDGKLSRREFEAAISLLKYDDNDDELVSATELGLGGFRGDRLGRQPAMQPPRVPATALSSLILLPKETGPRRRAACLTMARGLVTTMDKKKAGKLKREDTPFTEVVFDEIDRNKDGLIDAPELARVLSAAPMGEFSVRMGGSAIRTPKEAKGDRKPDLLALKMGSTRLTVAPGPAAQAYGDSGLEDYLLGFFRTADKEKRGFITRSQLTGEGRLVLATMFDQADRNRDGRLTEAEIKEYVEVADSARGVQLVLALNDGGQGLFQALDANRDGFLSIRELRTAWTRLADMDTNEDGAISKDEFPRQVTLLVGARATTGGGIGGMPQEETARRPDRGPLWFRKMDRNGDGDVSRSEWLGLHKEFEEIDTDADGMINLDEAEAHDAKARKK